MMNIKNTNLRRGLFSIASVMLMGLCAPQAQAQRGQDVVPSFTAVAPGVVKDDRTDLEWIRCTIGQKWNESDGTCDGEPDIMSWDESVAVVRKLQKKGGYAGRTGWRIPSIRELLTLRYCKEGFGFGWEYLGPNVAEFNPGGKWEGVIDECHHSENVLNRADIDGSAFPQTITGDGQYSSAFWSSTPSVIEYHPTFEATVRKFGKYYVSMVQIIYFYNGKIGKYYVHGDRGFLRLVRSDPAVKKAGK